jgi:type IV secretory pathway VirB10-like protein
MNTIRVERPPSRAGAGIAARLGKRSLLSVLSACVVFGGCFAIGRATSAHRAPAVESSAQLSVATVHAVVPLHLAQAAPIELSIEPPPPPKPAPAPAAPAVIAPQAQLRSPVPTVQTPAPAPPAPAPAAPERSAPPSKPAPSHSGGSHPSSPAGTFESSG